MKHTYLFWDHINHIKLGPQSKWQWIRLCCLLELARLAYVGIKVTDSNGLVVKLSPPLVASCTVVRH